MVVEIAPALSRFVCGWDVDDLCEFLWQLAQVIVSLLSRVWHQEKNPGINNDSKLRLDDSS